MSTSPVQPGFQSLRQIPTYLWHRWKVQPMAIKGSAYVLLALAGVGTIYFIAQRLFSNASSTARNPSEPPAPPSSSASSSSASRGQRKFKISDAVDVFPNQSSERPFCWNFHFFGPNLDVPVFPTFDSYSQGIFHFELGNVLDASNIDDHGNSKVPVTVSFAHEGEVFLTQEIPAGESNANLFLQNLPYGKKVAVRFTVGASVKVAQFTVELKRGLYQIDQHLKSSSQALNEYIFLSPISKSGEVPKPIANIISKYHEFSRQPLGLSVGDKSCDPFNPTGKNAYLTLKNALNFFQVLALQFETSGSGSNPQNHRVSLTIVLDPDETRNLSEEIIRKHTVAAYKKAGKAVPQGLKINLYSLQQIIYNFY